MTTSPRTPSQYTAGLGKRHSRKKIFELRAPSRDRTPALWIFFIVFFAIIVARLFYLQVIKAPHYVALAQGQRELVQQLIPTRGEVFVRDVNTDEEFPLATNQELEFIFAVPRDIEDVDATVKALAGPLKFDQAAQDELKARLQDKEDLYETVKRQVEPKVWDEIQKLELPGIQATAEQWRVYPEKELAAQVIGYVGFTDDKLLGQYGIEGHFNDLLAGTPGQIEAETDNAGRRIISADSTISHAQDGADILLTIDRTIQHITQTELEKGCKKNQADYCDAIVLDPHTGEILAMAATPGFDPNHYEKVTDLQVFKNTAIYDSYEPGSTFKPLVTAAAVDLDLVTPDTTFSEPGCRKVDVFQICNFDKKGFGVNSVIGALERSSNVVMSQIAEKVGREKLFDYLLKFGFNALTGITLDKEAEAGITPAEDWSDAQLATIGFGQGIATTPLHLIAAEASFANDGKLMQPYIVKEIRHPDGTVEKFEPKQVGEPIKASTALTTTAMLVSAIENGVAEQARVDDYTMAGKTGTAQVAGAEGRYEGNKWVASFIGYGPIPDPRVIILVRLNNPKTSIHGANTAAPMFKELAPQILHYLRIPGNRDKNPSVKPTT
jgi:cell division protein FtsI/penicillin-binding protein 2